MSYGLTSFVFNCPLFSDAILCVSCKILWKFNIHESGRAKILRAEGPNPDYCRVPGHGAPCGWSSPNTDSEWSLCCRCRSCRFCRNDADSGFVAHHRRDYVNSTACEIQTTSTTNRSPLFAIRHTLVDIIHRIHFIVNNISSVVDNSF